MKLDARKVAGFLQRPGAYRVVLLYGEDSGLIRERAAALVRVVAESLDDPFRVVELERESVGRILEEITARPMTGGRRVVRVRDVTDGVTGLVQAVMRGDAEGLLVLEAAALTGRSRLRALVESSSNAISIACPVERGAELSDIIGSTLRERGFQVDDEVRAFLMESLGGDRANTRQELEKLALFSHAQSCIELVAAMTALGDAAGMQLDDTLFAALQGSEEAADRGLVGALAEGASPVSVLRAALLHLQKLGRIHTAMRGGLSAADAVNALRPPIFFRRQDAMARAATLWPPAAIERMTLAVWEAEHQCKRTGLPAATLARQSLLDLARHASYHASR